jgi:hypothetical protein
MTLRGAPMKQSPRPGRRHIFIVEQVGRIQREAPGGPGDFGKAVDGPIGRRDEDSGRADRLVLAGMDHARAQPAPRTSA